MKKSHKIALFIIIAVSLAALAAYAAYYVRYNSQPEQCVTPNVNAKHLKADVIEIDVNGCTITLVGMEGGTFKKGATAEQEKDIFKDERPVHSITLGSFYISKYPVSNELWEAVNSTTGSVNSSFGGTQPKTNVTWDECQAFIDRLNKLTGKHFRLPTEAEWEFAARGGVDSKHFKYSGANSIEDVVYGNIESNESGLCKMNGFANEWCSDYYGSYSMLSQTNPVGPSSGAGRVYRGGHFNTIDPNDRECRVSARYYLPQNMARNDLSFRLVLTAE